jgi:hypothetical protein
MVMLVEKESREAADADAAEAVMKCKRIYKGRMYEIREHTEAV